MAGDVTRDMFAPGGRTPGQPRVGARSIVPLEWLLCHPATFPWQAKGVRQGVTIVFQEDIALQLDAGFEGVIVFMKLLGHSNVQGINGGINWFLLVNKVPVFRTRWQFGGLSSSGFMDDLGAGNGLGDTWGDIRVWVEEGGLVTVKYNNNGGNADAMGWVLRGYGWPVDLRDEWQTRGWRK